jgi:hypothetical protein
VDASKAGDRFLRQLAFADPTKFRYPITILGIGAIGSAVAIAASKLGSPRGLTLIDPDTFEDHNVANQLCQEKESRGKSKVTHIGELCIAMGAVGDVIDVQAKLEGEKLVPPPLTSNFKTVPAKPYLSGIVISTPDNMIARQDLWKLCMLNAETPFLIDARMAAQYLQILTVDTFSGPQIKAYRETLIADKDATPDPCSARGIIYTSFIAGGIVTLIIKKLQLGEPVWSEIRMDIATLQLEFKMPDGEWVSNRDALAMAQLKAQ